MIDNPAIIMQQSETKEVRLVGECDLRSVCEKIADSYEGGFVVKDKDGNHWYTLAKVSIVETNAMDKIK